jgi:hypothetical protein
LLEHDAGHLVRAGANLDDLWAALVSLGYQPHGVAGDALSPIENGPLHGDVLWLPIP